MSLNITILKEKHEMGLNMTILEEKYMTILEEKSGMSLNSLQASLWHCHKELLVVSLNLHLNGAIWILLICREKAFEWRQNSEANFPTQTFTSIQLEGGWMVQWMASSHNDKVLPRELCSQLLPAFFARDRLCVFCIGLSFKRRFEYLVISCQIPLLQQRDLFSSFFLC